MPHKTWRLSNQASFDSKEDFQAHQNLSLGRNRNTFLLDQTFSIWIYNIVMFN